MKALYTIWGDEKYIQLAIDAGIDTLLLAWENVPNTDQSTYYASYERNVEICRQFKGKVRILAVPLWCRQWTQIPVDQCLVQANVPQRRTPCPRSEAYIRSRTEPVMELIRTGIVDGAVWDIEHYENGTDVLPVFQHEIRCDCPRCVNASWEDQWKAHADILKPLVAGNTIQGHLLYDSWWALKRYPSAKPYLFTEETYSPNNDTKKQAKEMQWKRIKDKCRYSNDYHIVPGFWIELFQSTDKYLEYLRFALSSGTYDGYWIYTQKMLSRFSKVPDGYVAPEGPYESRLVDVVDPNFFSKLKQVNS